MDASRLCRGGQRRLHGVGYRLYVVTDRRVEWVGVWRAGFGAKGHLDGVRDAVAIVRHGAAVALRNSCERRCEDGVSRAEAITPDKRCVECWHAAIR